MNATQWLVLWLVGCLAAAGPISAGRTTFRYTRNASEIVDLWVLQGALQVLGGSKAPKLSGPPLSAGIIDWDASDDHELNPVRGYEFPRTHRQVVLSTGDAKLGISKVPYAGGDKNPPYADVVNSNIKGSHDAVVLDFWVLAWSRTGTQILFDFIALSNEGSPAALKLQGPGARDVLQIEMNGKLVYNSSMDKVWQLDYFCEPRCKPPKPGGRKMHFYASSKSYTKIGPKLVGGKEYHIKLRLADTGSRLVDSAVILESVRG